MAIDKDAYFTPSEVDDLLGILQTFLGDDPEIDKGIESLTLSEITHFVSTVH